MTAAAGCDATEATVPVAEANSLAQATWASLPMAERARVLRRARGILAGITNDLAAAIPSALARTLADTRVAEILPLLAACKFLETDAAQILAPRKLGRRGLPWWLVGVHSEVRRVPYGSVLVIGPANYPLFLLGVQVLQALCAGNAVTWKPGLGGEPVARLFARALAEAGLPGGLLRVTDDSLDAAREAIAQHPDKIFFTGSAESGRAVLRAAAETATPVVAELSGCDAVIALPSADPERVIAALAFGMRLNGSATCMAPRRLVLVGWDSAFIARLRDALAFVPAVALTEKVREQLAELVRDAEAHGATVYGANETHSLRTRPVLITNARPEMRCMQADIFAPVLSVMQTADAEAALAAEARCPLSLTVAIFGDAAQALALADRIQAGTVIVNDLIVPTADPRIPFAPRRGSGFGATRGAEGLLDMTAIKTVLVRRGKSRRHLQPTGDAHAAFFDGIIRAGHGSDWRERLRGVREMITAGKKLE